MTRQPDDPVGQAADQALSPAPNHEYVTYNFDAINDAIDLDASRHSLMHSLYRSELRSNRVNIYLYASVSVSLFIIAVAFVWWLLFQPKEHIEIDFGDTSSPIESLEALSRQEQQNQQALDEVEQTFIDTSFTVFTRAIISTGEYVVTGKTFDPDDLATPTEQYCYLEKSQSSASLSGLPLAIVDNGKFVAETKDPAMLKLAKKHCRFSGLK